MVKKTLTFSQRLVDMVREVEELKGYPTFSSVVHQAIVELHAKFFPAYVRAPKEIRTAADKAREKHDMREAKLQIVIEEQTEICTKLRGKVIDDPVNGMICRYNTYNFKNVYEQNVPLDQLIESLVLNQYHPSKEKVEQLLALKTKSKSKKDSDTKNK